MEKAIRAIRIFISSSNELRDERLEIVDMISNLNNALLNRNIILYPVKWEYLDASMCIEQKQDEYNAELCKCEICIVLFWNKLGLYTKEELDTAYSELKKGNNPKKLYIYFKNSTSATDDLIQFKESFPKKYGHFPCFFENVDTLKTNFILQFINYLCLSEDSDFVKLENTKVVVNGYEMSDLQNVPFLRDNKEYNLLQAQIESLGNSLSRMNEGVEKIIEKTKLCKAINNLNNLEQNIWETALLISKLKNEKVNSNRLFAAIEYFENGDNEKANEILNIAEINKDLDENLELLKLGQKQLETGNINIKLGKSKLKTNLNELLLRIKVLKNYPVEKRTEEILEIYDKILEIAHFAYDVPTEELSDIYSDAGDEYNHVAGRELQVNEYTEKSLTLYQKAEEILIAIKGRFSEKTLYSSFVISISLISLNRKEEACTRIKNIANECLEELGEKQKSTAIAFLYLGSVYEAIGLKEESSKAYSQSLKIHISVSSEIRYIIETTYKLCMSFETGNTSKAFDLYSQALSLLQSNNIPKNNYLYGITYHGLGNSYLLDSKNKKAIDYFSLALTTEVKHILVDIFLDMGKAYFNIKDYKNALKNYNKALKLRGEEIGYDHTNTIYIFLEIERIHVILGDFKMAKKIHDTVQKLLWKEN